MVTFKEFKEAVESNPELAVKFLNAQKALMENPADSSKAELVVKAAAEVGFEISVEEVERAFAANQQLSEEDLVNVSGGGSNDCSVSYSCNYVFVCETTAKAFEVLDSIF